MYRIMNKTDVLVIGSGISGLSYAIKIAEQLPETKITIVTKSDESESNTKYAQGGLAVVTDFDQDSFEKHIQDTIKAGDGYGDEEVIRMVIKEGPKRFNEIVEWGAKFDREKNGEYKLGREGGHTEDRIIHHKDITGFEIERALLEEAHTNPNINILDHHFVIDLITEHHIKDDNTKEEERSCYGAYVLNLKTSKIEKFTAKVTLVATGGAGQVYKNTTNPIIATGDGIGLAYRAKAKIKNMQFIQFHPTALYSPRDGQLFLISEAVRGEGAKLVLKDGSSFMKKYDEREELASRDIVARAIDNEMKVSGDDYVCLDCTQMDQKEFLDHFPNIYDKCKSEGIDPFTDLIPVVPASHYMCGGIVVDKEGQANLKNLFSVGECTCTGLHGANRLASNSLLEGLVYGHNAAMKTIELLKTDDFQYDRINKIPDWDDEGLDVTSEMIIIKFLRQELQSIMSDFVSIVRSDLRLEIANQRINQIYQSVQELYNLSILSPQLSELRNLVSVAYIIVIQSQEMNENRGAFFNKDLVNEAQFS